MDRRKAADKMADIRTTNLTKWNIHKLITFSEKKGL